jgi:hypothetical protein
MLMLLIVQVTRWRWNGWFQLRIVRLDEIVQVDLIVELATHFDVEVTVVLYEWIRESIHIPQARQI